VETLQSDGGAGAARAADPEVGRRVAELAPWFHNLHLPDGTQTAPDHPLGDFPASKWRRIAPALPADLRGWSVLDVGCNAGFYTFELARRGARVTAVDHDPRYLAQARWAAVRLDLAQRVRFVRADAYQLARQGIEGGEAYDLVLFLGVFYHLRYPLLALDGLARRTRRLMVFQSLSLPGEEVVADGGDRPLEARGDLLAPGWPKMAFLEGSFAGDPTNWWVPNRAAAEAMLRSAGLEVVARPEPETYVCRPSAAGGRDAARHLRAVFGDLAGE
jgi:tRNA (mo5U34)-methyltransferase